MRILFALFLTIASFASEIKTLNQGACWIQDGNDLFKGSSFNDGVSYQIGRNNLTEIIEYLATQKISFEEINSLDSFVHCSGLGLRHIFKISLDNEVNYCLWSKFEKGKFKFIDFDLADDYQGICDGIVSNRLIVSGGESFALSDMKEFIESLGVKVLKEEILYKDVFSITLDTKSNEILKIQSQLKQSKIFRISDLVIKNRPIGDSISVESLMYSAK